MILTIFFTYNDVFNNLRVAFLTVAFFNNGIFNNGVFLTMAFFNNGVFIIIAYLTMAFLRWRFLRHIPLARTSLVYRTADRQMIWAQLLFLMKNLGKIFVQLQILTAEIETEIYYGSFGIAPPRNCTHLS